MRRYFRFYSSGGIFVLFLTAFFVAAVSGASPIAWAQTSGAKGPVDLVTAIEAVAKQNIPAVVHIEVTERQEVANPLLPFENDPFFHYFFNVPKNMPKKFRRELKGLGTGMIIDAEGHILTNNHVVGGANKISVLLANGQSYSDKSVKLIGTDPKTDLAVIQISAKERLPYVTFGDSDKAGVGQWVVAIGHPRGLDQTVTQGIISAKHRRGVSDPNSYQDFLQTDAAINPGNSGGPLLNLQGEVIGVNAAIASESGGFEGIGFAIPSNMATHITKQLIAHGKVERGWMGLSIQDLTPELARSFDLSTTKGVLIGDVVKGGPADIAGIKKGDIITAYQGKQVPDSGTFRNDVATATIGQQVKMTILRKGTSQEVTVRIGSQQEENKILATSLKERFGVEVRPATAKEIEKYGLSSGHGVVVAWVDPKGALGKAGFELGDMILKVNDEPVDDPQSFAARISAVPHRQALTLLALDHKTGESGYVQVVVP